jgi:HSP20 family molecular chaperone IbpA
MSRLVVHPAVVHRAGRATFPVADPVSRQAEQIPDAVRRRAYELSEQKGCVDGADPDDWLQAEREVLYVPQTEIRETAKSFSIRIPAPAFSAEDLEAIALPSGLLVRASTQVQFFYRPFDFSKPIGAEKVKATFNEGKLTIQAPQRVQSVTVQAAAA